MAFSEGRDRKGESMNEDKLVATVEDAMSFVDEARAELRSAYDLIDQYSALVRKVAIYMAVLAILFSASAVAITIAATR